MPKYYFTITKHCDEVHECVVSADDKEHAKKRIKDNAFDVIDEHEIDGEYDFESIDDLEELDDNGIIL